MSNKTKQIVEEKIIHPMGGLPALFGILGAYAFSILLIVLGSIACSTWERHLWLPILGIIAAVLLIIAASIACAGLHIVNPNEAIVLALFGQYYGTIREPGYYFTNPFASLIAPERTGEESQTLTVTTSETTGTQVKGAVMPKKKISLKTMTLNNRKQKVNDVMGNPIIIGTIVIWKVVDPTKAVFSVENYQEFLSVQCDTTIRHVARQYPYDVMDERSEEKTLRGSSQEISDLMQEELQKRVDEAGLEIEDVRITTLAYAEEIAAAMLQKQQAVAIIAARQKIVEGAVGMVKMAIDQLNEDEVVVLDEERKAQMVSNLLVVLCGNKDAQPIVNSGSIY